LCYAGFRLRRLDYLGYLIQFAILVLSLTVHEAAHAWSANRLGDPTARRLGRLSLNPVVHIDPIGTLLLPLVGLFAGGGFLLGWAKPVPVNIANLRGDWRRKYGLIAAAGPASNLVIATLIAVLLQPATLGSPLETSSLGLRVLYSAVIMNVWLAVFNLLPVPPLDGGNVLGALLPPHIAEAFDQIRPYGFLIIIGLIAAGYLVFLEPIRDTIVSLLI
jgi:Zn-dependent protease